MRFDGVRASRLWHGWERVERKQKEKIRLEHVFSSLLCFYSYSCMFCCSTSLGALVTESDMCANARINKYSHVARQIVLWWHNETREMQKRQMFRRTRNNDVNLCQCLISFSFSSSFSSHFSLISTCKSFKCKQMRWKINHRLYHHINTSHDNGECQTKSKFNPILRFTHHTKIKWIFSTRKMKKYSPEQNAKCVRH